MARSKTSKQWLKEHFDDIYVKKSREEGYRSRASYKLLEIQGRDRLIKPGMAVVDLGAAPGGWSQVAAKLAGAKGRVVANDILPMESIERVEFIQGDFTEDAALEAVLAALNGNGADLVMSDMAPNISGMKQIDQPRAMYLAELALELARDVLKADGAFLVKLFQGAEFPEFRDQMRARFAGVKTRKPQASRARSNEIYLLGTGFRGRDAINPG